MELSEIKRVKELISVEEVKAVFLAAGIKAEY